MRYSLGSKKCLLSENDLDLCPYLLVFHNNIYHLGKVHYEIFSYRMGINIIRKKDGMKSLVLSNPNLVMLLVMPISSASIDPFIWRYLTKW